MSEKLAFRNRISVRILAVLLVLFSITAVIISVVNMNNIRQMYEENFTERVLLTNALLAAVVDSEDVNYFVELMTNQDEGFKRRQVEYYYNRLELWDLQEAGASEEEQQVLLDRMAEFQSEVSALKTEKYWDAVDELKKLKDVSRSTYLYIMSDTGLMTDEGEILYSFILDADDDPELSEPDSDGLGTSDISQDTIITVYESKKQMDWVNYYDGEYGELYYAYAPIFDEGGEVIAVFGTDLDLEKMNESIAASTLLFNATFTLTFVIIFLAIFFFLSSSIVMPLKSLTDTAHELAMGNIYAQTRESALKQKTEMGTLAHAVNDMSLVYQDMIMNAGRLFAAANIGKLDMRSDVSRYKGDIKKLIKQINDTLDATTLYLNSIPESIFIMSKDFEMYFRNECFTSRFGDLGAKEFLSKLFEQNDESETQYDEELLKERTVELLEQGGNSVTVWMNGSCFSVILTEIVLSEKTENSILVVANDITDLMREKEKAQAAAKAKSDFLSRMSHEMRTPMNAIIGMTTIAEDLDDISKMRHCFETIDASSRHLLGIINDVLDMSKIEAGKFELVHVPINIEKILMNVCHIVIDNMEKKHQHLNVIMSKDLELDYLGDDLRLSQIIMNLLSNAVKFTEEYGKITLIAEKIEQRENKNLLRFSVSDTGVGMTAEQMARLFNAFEQADGGVTRKYGGTGLGLAISKSIVEKMDGRIWVDSEPGVGSTFSFEVMLERASYQESIKFEGIHPERLKLLLIESDEDVQKRFLSIIHNFDMNADTANNAWKALSYAETARRENRPYDIIFLAFDLPATKGFELVKMLREIIDKKTVIVILTTFLDWHRIEKEAIQNSITHFITKPLFPSSVLDAVNDIVGKTMKSHVAKTDGADATPDFSGVQIILAEDVEINREIFMALLEETRISIDTAENGLIALNKFQENPDKYDLVVMDIQMPEMDGYAATRAIRATDTPKAKTIPIIALTANAFKEDIDRCLESGMNDHLSKPIDQKSMLKKLRYYIENSKRSTGGGK